MTARGTLIQADLSDRLETTVPWWVRNLRMLLSGRRAHFTVNQQKVKADLMEGSDSQDML